jgi:hypothetical protein
LLHGQLTTQRQPVELVYMLIYIPLELLCHLLPSHPI